MTRLKGWAQNPRVRTAIEAAATRPMSQVATTEARGPVTIRIGDLSIPSKKNQYRIRFNQAFFKAILPIVQRFKTPYWIAPAPEVEQAEMIIAWAAKTVVRGTYLGPVSLVVEIRGRMDVDNCLGVICDGLQRSGVILNDRQIRRIQVEHLGAGSGCTIRIEPMKEGK